jgi:outer membrane protein assembly factor BamD (BamD/ComL family)
MIRACTRLALVLAGLLAFPHLCPAPLIYRPGEGWTYEPFGKEGSWHRQRAEDQLAVAREAFEKQDYGLTLKAARRVLKQWPLSDHAPEAQYLIGRCYEARGDDERAFREYQKLVENYPKNENYDQVVQRQFEIASRYLEGQWFKIWGYIPAFPSMEKTAVMYDKVIRNGPYSDVAPQSQINIGIAREKRSEFGEAVKAYEKAADRYHDQRPIAAEALFRAGLAYQKQAKTAEYDQSAAAHAIATFIDFIALYPNDPRVSEAQEIINELRTEQARGNYQIARFYEKSRQWDGALVYYNEVLIKDPNSPFAAEAKERIEAIKNRTRN